MNNEDMYYIELDKDRYYFTNGVKDRKSFFETLNNSAEWGGLMFLADVVNREGLVVDVAFDPFSCARMEVYLPDEV